MKRPNSTVRIVALTGVAALALAACSSSGGGEPAASDTTAASTGTPLYLVDGNIGNGPLGELPPGTLEGVKGTLPGAEIDSAFRDRLNEIDPDLPGIGYSYGPETYDAVNLVALAAIQGDSDAGRDISANMREVSEGGTKCTSFKDCADLLKKGEDIDYDGLSGPVEFDQFGDPTEATVGIYQYNAENQVPGFNADADPAYPVDYNAGVVEPSGDTAPTITKKVNDGADGQLVFGGLFPVTGSLASLGPPEVAAYKLAIQDINDAGGVLGKNVKGLPGDSGDTTTDTASLTVDKHLKAGVDAIIGAASSSVTLSVLDKVSGAGVIQVSMANTSPELTTFEDGGMYWRTAPSDVLQGRVLGNLILGDGHQTVGILVLQDSYGEGLANYTEVSIGDGGGSVVDTEFYDPAAATFTSQVSKIKAAAPDAIVLIGFDESAKVVQELVQQGIGPNS